MEKSSIAKLEALFAIAFPPAYRRVLETYPLKYASEELCQDAADLVRSNEGLRRQCPAPLQWRSTCWWIGGDGSGGFYFIDCAENELRVYYYDHEVPPDHPTDVERLKPQPLQVHIDSLLESERRFDAECEQLSQKIANRKWWQFWIPKTSPAWMNREQIPNAT